MDQAPHSSIQPHPEPPPSQHQQQQQPQQPQQQQTIISVQTFAHVLQQQPSPQTFNPPLPQDSYYIPNSRNLIVPSPMATYHNYHPYLSSDMKPNLGGPLFQPMPPLYPNQNMPSQYMLVGSSTPQKAGLNGPPQSWQADVYAPAFVPSFYLQINSLPAFPVRSTPPPSINYPMYISSFAGASFLSPLPPYPSLQSSPVREAHTLAPETFLRYFSEILVTELSSQHQSIRQYDMYNVPLYPHDLTASQFRLIVPGIREDCPIVAVGDVIHLRQIRTSGYNMFPPTGAGFTGLQYEAYVYGIDRQAGILILRVDDLRLESGLFNVSFLVQEQLLGPHARSVLDISKLLANMGENHDSTEILNRAQRSLSTSEPPLPCRLSYNYTRKMLFPEEADGILQKTLNTGLFNHRWFDTELNSEQQKAVDAILTQNYGTVPYLISGPPGTGKTKTIVEAALQLIFAAADRKHHIILCAPSNQAADTLTKRLIPHLAPRVLFRMNSPSRSFAEVPSEILTYCFVHNDCFGLPDWRKLMRYRVIVTTCRDCSMLVEARCTNRDLARWERVITAGLKGEELPGLVDGMDVGEWTPSGSVAMDDVKLHWSALLVDEAAQGTEPDVLIPLSVVIPPEECSKEKPMFVMAGDPKQLGSRTASRLAPLETSLLERLFSRPLYSEHPLSRQSISKLGGGSAPDWVRKISAKLLPYNRPPFTNLIRNYRSHPAILAVPSALFYHDTLVPEANDVHGLESWDGWQGRKWPVLFMANIGNDEPYEEGSSFFNIREMRMACKTAQRLVESGLLQPHEIAIMSPFMEQVRRIRKTLRTAAYMLRDVNVGPLEAYQGSEHKVVILCTTRTRERFLDQDLQRGLGIIFESKRFNVAMTRAKQGLIVIGNPWILHRDPVWLAFLSFCWRNGAIVNDPEEAKLQSTCDSKGSTAVCSPSMSEFDTKTTVDNDDNNSSKENSPGPTFTSTILKDVKSWKPSQDEQVAPQYLSRLEQALLLKDKLAGCDGHVSSPQSGAFNEDPMWAAGMAAEEALRGVDYDSISLL